MRITNSMMGDMFLSDASNSLNRVFKYQNQVDSTKRVSKISDDPQATMVALRARNKLSNLDLYNTNITTVRSYLTEAESAAEGMNELLQSAYEEIVSAANGSKNENDLSTIADLIENYKNEVVTIANTNVGTSYVFGGYNFSGTTDGINVTQPFSVNEATEHLIYNGIDMSKVSWAEDYEKNTELMASYNTVISENTSALDATSSDEYARDTICQKALTGMKNLLTSGKEALFAAKNYGIDESSDAYQDLSKLIYGSGKKGESGYVKGLDSLTTELYNECSKGFAYNMSADGINNAFSIKDAKDILSSACELIYNTDSSAGTDCSMSQAMETLKTAIDSDMDSEGIPAALADESGKRAKLLIGTNHSAEYTFTGMDILGSGTDSVHYILDKCVSLLRKGDTDGLSKMISEIQSAQDRVLGFEAGIGTAENRMDLLSSRYETSQLNYIAMRSDAVDADMAEAITNLTTAQTVYNAALTGGAEILQTSLLNFLN